MKTHAKPSPGGCEFSTPPLPSPPHPPPLPFPSKHTLPLLTNPSLLHAFAHSHHPHSHFYSFVKLNHSAHGTSKEEKLDARFRAEIETLKKVMLEAIDTRCKEDDIVNTCDAVLHASSNMFVSVYNAVWNLVCYTDEVGLV